MKKVLLIAALIGLFMATAMDLQARYRRNDQPRQVRSRISSSQSRHAPSLDRSNRNGQYDIRSSRQSRGVISSGQSRRAPSLDRSNSYGQYGIRSGRQSRGGISFGQSRHAPSHNRYNNYGGYNNYSGRYGRGGISLGLFLGAPAYNRYNSYGRYYYQSGRYVASEIRRNEERIWILEQRLDRLYRYGDSYEIRELEQEIEYLQSRNDFLRSRLY